MVVKKKNFFLDLSSLIEGIAVDSISSLLDEKKIDNYLISIGGTVKTKGKNFGTFWKIAIKNSFDNKNQIEKIINLYNCSMSTSGIQQNYYEFNRKKFSHLLNPKTGWPVDNKLISATVISKSALEADTWDTGLMILGIEKAKKISIKEKLLVYLIFKKDKKNSFWISPQLKKYIYKHS